MIDVKFKEGALAELMAFKRNGNRAIVSKIEQLVRDIQCHPETGIGKPERLRANLAGYWSRRINTEYRVVYRIEDDGSVTIYSLKGHYER